MAASPTSRPTRTPPTAWWTRCWPTREARRMPRPITFLSDYGLADEFVGVVHAVIAHECPARARHRPLTRRPAPVRARGALMLARALPYAPPGVHLAVVDPGVGARRRAVALRTALDDRLLVGPDNGLLMPRPSASAWSPRRSSLALALAARARVGDLPRPRPVRARRRPPRRRGGARRRRHPARPGRARADGAAAAPTGEQGRLAAHAWSSTASATSSSTPVRRSAGAHRPSGRDRDGRPRRALPADVRRRRAGRLLVYEDAAGILALAVNGGEAAAELGGIAPGDEVRIKPS